MFDKINIKKIVLVLIAVTVIAFVGAGLSALIVSRTGKSLQRDINIEKSFQSSEVGSINVSTISYDIKLVKSDNEEIKVHLHGITNLPEQEAELKVELLGDRLEVRMERKNSIRVGFVLAETVRLDIYIPSNFYETIILKSTSGDISVEELNVDKLEMKTISGDIDGNNMLTNSSKLETTSGDMMLRGFEGELKVKTISGALFVEYNELSGAALISSTSGDIELKIPEGSALSSTFDSVSGDFHTNIALTKMGNVSSSGEDGTDIRVKTVSGNYKLFKK